MPLGDRGQKSVRTHMAAGCQVTNWRALLGLDNQLTLIKLTLTELWAMIFYTEFGSVVNRLRPSGIKLWSF